MLTAGQEAVIRVDEIDLRMMDALRGDGRIGLSDLAGSLGISRATTSKRLAALLDSGEVQVVGIVHPATLGIRSLAHVSISVDQPVRPVADALAAIDQVPFVSLASGSFPLIAEARTRDERELAAVLERIRGIDGVTTTETLFYTDLAIDVLRPARVENVELDRLDNALLSLLQQDGRLSYTALGERAGVATGTARTRVLRLIDQGVVRIGALSKPGRQREYDVGIGVRVRGRTSAATDLLAERDGIRFLAATLGRYDLLATVRATSLAAAVGILDGIRALRPVLHLDSWVHLETVKEVYRYPAASMSGAPR